MNRSVIPRPPADCVQAGGHCLHLLFYGEATGSGVVASFVCCHCGTPIQRVLDRDTPPDGLLHGRLVQYGRVESRDRPTLDTLLAAAQPPHHTVPDVPATTEGKTTDG